MGDIVIFDEAYAYTPEGLYSKTLTQDPISRIKIKHTVGTPGGGTYVANCAIEFIQIRINGILLLDWNGETGFAGVTSIGIKLLREFYAQLHNSDMPAENFIIEFPFPIPATAQIQLIFKMASLASMGVTGSWTGTFDVVYEKDTPGKVVIIPYVTWHDWNDLNKNGHCLHYIPQLPENMKLRYLLFITDDGGTLADDTYARLTISMQGKILFDGKMVDIQNDQQARSMKAMTTGFFMIPFKGGMKVPNNAVKLDFVAVTAGTAKHIRPAFICW